MAAADFDRDPAPATPHGGTEPAREGRAMVESSAARGTQPIPAATVSEPFAVTLRRLRFLTWFGLAIFVVITHITRVMVHPYLGSIWAHVLIDAVIVSGAVFFFGAVFHVIDQMQLHLRRRADELEALHTVGLDIHGELSLEGLLQRIVDRARPLLHARYGALSVIADNGRIESFITSGMDADTRQRIGPPPRGHGLLAVVLEHGQRLRIADVTRDPRRRGFPDHHPVMHSLVAVPITCSGPFRGNLYLAERADGAEFTVEDEEVLARFASMAAIAIDNAYLHERAGDLAAAEERLRIAHEMHDGLAQVLAYVNTKAQAVAEFLRQGRNAEAEGQLQQLASAAREVYADTRESILNLRTSAAQDQSFGETLQHYVEKWQDQSGIRCDATLDVELSLKPQVELQVLRIAQEALSNIRKHAGATRARVEARCVDSRFRLVVEDDGAGFDPEAQRRGASPRFGLTTMRERATTIGATLHVDTAPGSGTRVSLELPVPASSLQGEAHANSHR